MRSVRAWTVAGQQIAPPLIYTSKRFEAITFHQFHSKNYKHKTLSSSFSPKRNRQSSLTYLLPLPPLFTRPLSINSESSLNRLVNPFNRYLGRFRFPNPLPPLSYCYGPLAFHLTFSRVAEHSDPNKSFAFPFDCISCAEPTPHRRCSSRASSAT